MSLLKWWVSGVYWKKYQWRENVRQSNFEQEWKKNYPFESYLDFIQFSWLRESFMWLSRR